MSDDAIARAQWERNARHWSLLAAPLRPSPEDTAIVTRVANERASSCGRPLRALVLGVTRELTTLAWPAGTSLVAMDSSEAMIAASWPAVGAPADASASCADWRAMPLDDGAIDLIAGDGSLNALAWRDYATVASEARRVLAPGGLCVLRVFMAPDAREDVRVIADDLWGARIGSFHVFKWRLVMALQPSIDEGVRLGAVWDAWRAICPDPRALASKLGWAPAVIGTIDSYRDASHSYTFPTLEELRRALAPRLDERAIHVPSYELRDRCPTFVLERA